LITLQLEAGELSEKACYTLKYICTCNTPWRGVRMLIYLSSNNVKPLLGI